MPQVRIITDSAAGFEDPHTVEDYGITVVPLRVHFGDKVFKDKAELDAEEMFHRMQRNDVVPRVTAPSIADFEEAYQSLARSTSEILVLTHSRKFTKTFANAQSARSSLLGRCKITVIDSLTLSVGLGYLIEDMVKRVEDGASLDDLIRDARTVIPRLYSVYYVDSLEYIQRTGLIAQTQALLGEMLEIKPLITIEDGELMTMEKVRTHPQAVDRMMEFIAEFTEIERLCIVQNTLRTTDRTRMLQDRLALEFSRTNHPVRLYEPLLATLIGADGMGVSLLEGEPAVG